MFFFFHAPFFVVKRGKKITIENFPLCFADKIRGESNRKRHPYPILKEKYNSSLSEKIQGISLKKIDVQVNQQDHKHEYQDPDHPTDVLHTFGAFKMRYIDFIFIIVMMMVMMVVVVMLGRNRALH